LRHATRGQIHEQEPPQSRFDRSDDPGDGSRNSDRLGRTGGTTAAEKPPAHDRQDQSTIEAFGDEGAGIAAKE
jgi:hypothetical protein